MKKVLALMVALVLVLTAVSALAGGSPETPDKKSGGSSYGSDTTEEKEPELGKAADTEATKAIKQLIIDGQNAGDALSKLPDEVKSKIPAGMKTVNEMATYKLEGDVSKVKSLVLVFTFETPYAEGEEVTLLIGIPGANETEWIVLTGKANKEGAVVVTVDEATLNEVSNNPFVVIPVSK